MDWVLNKGTLVYSQAEGQDSLRQAILYDYNNKNNEKQVKESSNTESELASSLQQYDGMVLWSRQWAAESDCVQISDLL